MKNLSVVFHASDRRHQAPQDADVNQYGIEEVPECLWKFKCCSQSIIEADNNMTMPIYCT